MVYFSLVFICVGSSIPCILHPLAFAWWLPPFLQARLTSPQITLLLLGLPPGVAVLPFYTHKHISCMGRIKFHLRYKHLQFEEELYALFDSRDLTYLAKTSLPPQPYRSCLLEVLFPGDLHKSPTYTFIPSKKKMF